MSSHLCLLLVSIFIFPIFQDVAFGQTDTNPLIKEFQVPSGSHPHDVAPAKNGSIWYTAQRLGALGILDPISGRTHHIDLGEGSAPHGVIVGPDGTPWITDGGGGNTIWTITSWGFENFHFSSIWIESSINSRLASKP